MFDTGVGIRDRSCVKRSKARQHVSRQPNRGAAPIYFYVERWVRQAFVSRARHRAISFCCAALFLPVIPCSMSPYPKDPKAHLLEKLLYLSPLARSMNYQSDGMSSLLFATSDMRPYIWKLNFIPSWLLRHSFGHLRQYENMLYWRNEREI